MSSKEDSFPVIGLSEIMDIQGGAQPPASTFKDALEPGYVRFVQIRDFETDAHLTYIQQLPKWRYCSVDDVLIARYGASVGRICRGVAGAYNVALAKVIPKGGVELGYLYYLLKSDFFQGPIAAISGRSAQAGFNKDDLAAIRVPVAPLKDQREISALLGCFDDRISVLRETNATLEAIAQALFKSWFVDFDPVRAKMAGRAPEGMDAATAALFPDALEESALGLVPKGWRHQAVSDVVEGVYDGPHATPPEANSGGIFLGIKNLTGTALDLSDIRFIDDADWARWTKRVEPRAGDIVFSYEATLGFFALIPPNLRCCLGRRLALIRPKANGGAGHFWFHQFVAQPFQTLLTKHTIQGATVNRIALKEFPSYTVLVPPPALQVAFDQVAASLWSRIHGNQQQSRLLTETRDTLLPRLISGQLRLPEAQAQLEDALA